MNRTSEPSLIRITQVCKAFGITLSDFFCEGEMIEITKDTKKLYDDWCALSKDEQDSVKSIVSNFMKKKHKA